MAKTVGLKQVADHARVSIGTVSNVLNRPDLVAKATVVRVRAVMDELGYVPNDLARQLKMGGGTTLGMVVLNLSNPFFAELYQACVVAAEAAGFSILLASSDQDPAREERYIDLFERQRVEGMLLALHDTPTSKLRTLHDRGMPIVVFSTLGRETSDVCTLGLDGHRAGTLVAEHLIDIGRRRILFVGGPVSQVNDRWNGLTTTCALHGDVSVSHVETADQTIAEGLAAGAQVASWPRRDLPDAVFAANDLLAIGLLQSLLERGVRVPEDIAIVGYDDIAATATTSVPLTTVHQPIRAIATEAVRLIRAERDPEHVHTMTLLPPELVIRRSSTPQA